MKLTKRNIIGFFGFALLGVMIWYFFDIFIYIILASILAMMGRPIVRFFDTRKIGKFHIPHTISTTLTLLIIIAFFVGIFNLIIPLVVNQATYIGDINTNTLRAYLAEPLSVVHTYLESIGVLKEGVSFVDVFIEKVREILNFEDFSRFFGGIISTTSSLFMAIFSICFLLFFFLKEEGMLSKWILVLVSDRNIDKSKTIFAKLKKLLSRYFIGLLSEVASMMTMEAILLSIMGVENAILIGFLGGLLNIIPYLGPVIGVCIGMLLALIGLLSAGIYTGIGLTLLKVIITFAAANLVDNIVLQPLIYGKSVKAHPIEIFLVIIMAGGLAGIPGMIVAIPVYTVIRIFAKEFLDDYKVVHEMTKQL